MTARAITTALKGDWSGRYGLVPGPGHSRLDRSLKIWADESGRILVHSFAGDDWRECRDYLKGLGWDIDGGERHNPRPAVYRDAAAPDDEAEERRRIAYARKIFAQRRPAAGSPVETYIRARGAALPPDAPVFYHPACLNGKNRLPAMLCPISDIRTGEFTGLHRTFRGTGKRRRRRTTTAGKILSEEKLSANRRRLYGHNGFSDGPYRWVGTPLHEIDFNDLPLIGE